VLLGKWDCGVEPLQGPGTAADGQQRLNARCAGTLKHRLSVFVKLREFQMRM
jgi:hypothetical protein